MTMTTDFTASQNPAFLRAYPEAALSGVSFEDVEVAFAVQVLGLVRPDSRVLDYGAGRGEWCEDRSRLRRELQLLKGRCREVVGCDVDEAVLLNPAVDCADAIDPAQPLPYGDASFDLIVSRYVFEHVQDPRHTAAELLRVLKPGGWICALTPNKWGYPAIGARLVSNRHHAKMIRRVQPGGRAAHDVFPTAYRLNTRRDLKASFGSGARVIVQRASGPPAYFFGNDLAFALFSLVHKLQPRAFATALMAFVQKLP